MAEYTRYSHHSNHGPPDNFQREETSPKFSNWRTDYSHRMDKPYNRPYSDQCHSQGTSVSKTESQRYHDDKSFQRTQYTSDSYEKYHYSKNDNQDYSGSHDTGISYSSTARDTHNSPKYIPSYKREKHTSSTYLKTGENQNTRSQCAGYSDDYHRISQSSTGKSQRNYQHPLEFGTGASQNYDFLSEQTPSSIKNCSKLRGGFKNDQKTGNIGGEQEDMSKVGNLNDCASNCVDKLSDIVIKLFDVRKDSDNLITIYRGQKADKKGLNYVLQHFKSDMKTVLRKHLFPVYIKGVPGPLAKFSSEDMLVKCIRETWLCPQDMKESGVSVFYLRKFLETIGNHSNTSCHWVKLTLKQGLFHSVEPMTEKSVEEFNQSFAQGQNDKDSSLKKQETGHDEKQESNREHSSVTNDGSQIFSEKSMSKPEDIDLTKNPNCTKIANRCYELLKDIATNHFEECAKSDNFMAQFHRKGRAKKGTKGVSVQENLHRFKSNLERVISKHLLPENPVGLQTPQAKFNCESTLIHCIRQTWLHPDKKGFRPMLFKKFHEPIGFFGNEACYWVRIIFRDNMFCNAEPRLQFQEKPLFEKKK